MSDDSTHKILAFLASAFALEGTQMCLRIELAHAPLGGYRADTLKTWTRESSPEMFDPRNQVFTERLVSEIMDIAENHAESYGAGKHRFTIRMHQGMGARLTHSFSLLPSVDSDAEAGLIPIGSGGPGGQSLGSHVDLQPSQSGQIAQLMRHLENRDRLALSKDMAYLQAMNQHAIQQREENQDLRAQLAAKDRERVEWMQTIEAANSKEHDRQIEARIVIGKEERKSQVTTKLVNLLPVFMSKLLRSGKDAAAPNPNQPKSPLAQLVSKFFESMTDAQREAIGELLEMEQQITLTEIMAAADGGNTILLPQMLRDLTKTFSPRQIGALLSALGPEQQQMFADLVKLATAQADPKAPPDAHVNGTTHESAEVS